MKLKRLFLMLCAAGLVLFLVAACDQIFPGEEKIKDDVTDEKNTTEKQYTPDGRPLVEISLKSTEGKIAGEDESRQLFLDLAKRFDFYEATFKDGTTTFTYYTGSARRPNELKMRVPEGSYPSAAEAVLFTGQYNNGAPILTATGVLTSNSGAIALTDSAATFTLTALKTDITDSANGVKVGVAAYNVDNLVQIANKKYPYFVVPNDNVAKSVAFNVTGFQSTNSGVSVSTTATDLKAFITPVFIENYLGLLSSEITVGATTFNITSGVGAFSVPLTIPATVTGFGSLAIDVPVKAINWDDNKDGFVWHIRNGVEQAEFDQGGTGANESKALGAGILIGAGISGPIDITPSF
ncbi:MAG: hypothetical protein LBC53_01305 [Spirochaetaceae bacterium]|nr:hypothetical protein [Spirochaetaceae bacterium]